MQLTRRRTRERSIPLQVGVVEPPTLPAASGLEEMFCAAYERVHGRAMDHAQRFLSADEAKDAVAEAMAEIWYGWTRMLPEQRTDSYFLGVVHHKVIDAQRVARRFASLEDAEGELAQWALGPDEQPSRGTTVADVIDLAVAKMPPKRREVFVLVREQDFTYKEAARILKVSESTVNSHMYAAGADVRAAFAGTGFRFASNDFARLPSETRDTRND